MKVSVILVHGTWGRGVFPSLRLSRKPFWFEVGSAFRERLSANLRSRGTECEFEVLVWSGANSIYHRDRAANMLARILHENARRNPEVEQVVIAHSHGGNIAAKALGLMRPQSRRIYVCYLATPFLQLFPRTVGVIESVLVAAAFLGLLTLVFTILLAIGYTLVFGALGPTLERWLLALGAWAAGATSVFIYHKLRRSNFSHRNHALVKATTNLRENQSQGDALILRAIDDEASLAISAKTIVNLMSLSCFLFLV